MSLPYSSPLIKGMFPNLLHLTFGMFSDLLKWPKKNQVFCPNHMKNGKVETLRKCQELCLNQNNCIGVHFVLGANWCDSCVDDVQQHGEAYDDIYLMTGNIVNFTKYVRYTYS